jgi:hypothetical protein
VGTSTGADIRVTAIVASSTTTTTTAVVVNAAAIVAPSDESWRLFVGFVRYGGLTLVTGFQTLLLLLQFK